MKTPQLLKRWWIFPMALVIAVAIVFTVFSSGSDTDTRLRTFTDFVRDGQLTSIQVSRDDRRIEYTLEGSEETYETRKEARVPLRVLLRDAGVADDKIDRIDVEFGARGSGAEWVGLLISFLPIILVLGLVFFFFRQSRWMQKMRWQFVGLVTNVDPVCGTTVNPGSSAGTSTFQGITYYFCSAQHKEQFDSDPVKYLLQK